MASLTPFPLAPGCVRGTTKDGNEFIRFQPPFDFLAFFAMVWTAACLFFSYGIFFGQAQVEWSGLALVIPFWFFDVLLIGYLKSVVTFTMYPERLVIDSVMFGRRSRIDVLRADVPVVRLARKRNSDLSSGSEWCLDAVSDSSTRLFVSYRKDVCECLGPILAAWAGGRYVEASWKETV